MATEDVRSDVPTLDALIGTAEEVKKKMPNLTAR